MGHGEDDVRGGQVKGDADAPLYFHYDSSANVTMRGSVESGMTVGEWNDLSRREQDQEIQQALNELLEIYPSADEEQESDW